MSIHVTYSYGVVTLTSFNKAVTVVAPSFINNLALLANVASYDFTNKTGVRSDVAGTPVKDLDVSFDQDTVESIFARERAYQFQYDQYNVLSRSGEVHTLKEVISALVSKVTQLEGQTQQVLGTLNFNKDGSISKRSFVADPAFAEQSEKLLNNLALNPFRDSNSEVEAVKLETRSAKAALVVKKEVKVKEEQ